MDSAQTKALAALQPFVHLVVTTKNPSPRFLADVVTRATSAQGTYIFTELLQLEPIQSLRSSTEFKGHLELLELFSWGTWEEYQAATGLPSLNDGQTLKLRQLTVLTLAGSPSFALTYPNLMKALDIPNVSELESLITAAIYAGLITARLSPTSNPPIVHITSTAPLRDLRPLSLGQLLKVLQTWEGRCVSVINDMESQIDAIKAAARKRAAKEAARDETLETALKESKTEGRDNSSLTGGPPGTRAAALAAKKAAAGFPVRTGGGGRPGRGVNKRDLEDTEDDADDMFEDAAETTKTWDGGMDLDENAPAAQTGRVAKRRGG